MGWFKKAPEYEVPDLQAYKIRVVNKVMGIMDSLVAQTQDTKVRHSLKLAKLRIYEEFFAPKQ